MPDSIMLDAPVKGSPVAPLLLTGPAVAPLLLTGPAPLKKKGHALLWTILAILVVAEMGGGWWWWHAHQTPPQAKAEPPMKVPVMTAAAATVPIYRSFSQITEAMR